MKYPLIAAKVARETWALKPEVFAAILAAITGQGEAQPIVQRAPAGIAFYRDDDEDDDEMSLARDGSVAVIPVRGILGKHLSRMETDCGGCSVDAIAAALDLAAKDEECETIVLAFDSPGGTVTGIPELAAKIRRVAEMKHVVAFCDSQCCSAALWLASACDDFFVSESAIIGSVGVYTLALDETRALEMQGVKVNAMSAGKYKLMGAPFKPLTDEERAMFQARVDALNAQFHAAMNRERNIDPAHLEGQTFSGTEAVAHGFCDGLVMDFAELLEIAAPASR